MKRIAGIIVCAVFLAHGCRQPSDIELVSDESTDNLEAIPVVLSDTSYVAASIDSTGVLPDDQLRFAGSFVINSVTWDAGSISKSIAYSRVFFADSVIRVLGRKIGFHGQDAGTVSLNGSVMLKLPHRISARKIFNRDSVLVSGVEYLAGLTDEYQPDRQYTWVVTKNLASILTVGTETPAQLTVSAPRGGTIHSRMRDLPVRWSGGKGSLSIIVSVYDAAQKTSSPLLNLRVRKNSGSAVIPSRFLTMLPPNTTYVLTFVLANRKEIQVLQPLSGTVLTQAASIVNSYIELR